MKSIQEDLLNYGVVPEGNIDLALRTNETIIDIPVNHIYKGYGISNPLQIGLPNDAKNEAFTLVKLSPSGSSSNVVGYCLYILSLYDKKKLFYWMAPDNATLDTIHWYEITTTGQNRGIEEIGISPISIVFIGDSIIEGYGSSDYNGGTGEGHSNHEIPNRRGTWYRNTGTKCWANQMIDYLTSTYSNVTACNNGIGGMSLGDIYDSIDLLAQNDNGTTPDFVIISAGTNGGRSQANINAYVTNPLINIINWLTSHGIVPIVLTNTPYTENSTNKPQAIQSGIIKACNKTGVRCYDVLSTLYRYIWEHNIPIGPSTDQTTFLYDSLHPSDIGYKIMFELLKEKLSV